MALITDSIAERTPDAGVTVDGLLIKNGTLPNVPGAALTADQAAALAAYRAALAAAEADQVLTASGPGEAAFAAPAGGGASEIVYAATVTGSAGQVPTATVMKNSTGVTLTWARLAGGFYNLNASGSVFDSTKTIVQVTPLSSGQQLIPSVSNPTQLLISVYTLAGAPNDGVSAAVVVLNFP